MGDFCRFLRIRTIPLKSTPPSLALHHHPCLLMNALLALRLHQLSQKHTTIPLSSPALPKPHYPLLCTIALASLVKGRWIDGKAQTVASLHFTCDTSAFLFTKLFCRQDGGIASPPSLSPHQPFQNRTIPLAFRRARGLPLPLHQSLLFPLIFAKEHLSPALLALPKYHCNY